MKMCLAPCYKGCTDERYAEESAAVEAFLASRGESRLVTLRSQRDQASADLEFETAATIHTQVQRVEGVRALASEMVRPLSQLRAILLQISAESEEVAVFLFQNGRLSGPAAFPTLGMRIQNEQSGSTSLFAQPMAIEPVPEQPSAQPESAPLNPNSGESRTRIPRGMLESRLEEALKALAGPPVPLSATERAGHLALLKRWYYRPEVRRAGEIFFPGDDGCWPVKAILRGVGRVAASAIAGECPRE